MLYNRVAAQAVSICMDRWKNFEAITIIAVQTIFGGCPGKAFLVLSCNRSNTIPCDKPRAVDMIS
jgi:hypothetical protein